MTGHDHRNAQLAGDSSQVLPAARTQGLSARSGLRAPSPVLPARSPVLTARAPVLTDDELRAMALVLADRRLSSGRRPA